MTHAPDRSSFAVRLRQCAREHGFPIVGFTKPARGDREGYPGGTLLVLARPYLDAPEQAFPALQLSMYYANEHRAYQDAGALAGRLSEEGYKAQAHLPLNHKFYAKRAGIATHGRNSLAQIPGIGSRFLLQLMHCDVAFEESVEVAQPGELTPACKGCNRCVSACPTSALLGDGNVNVSQCLRMWMNRGQAVPLWMRPLMDNRLLGCENCQRCCPQHRDLPKEQPEGLAPYLRLATWFTGQEEAFTQNIRTLGGLLGPNIIRSQRLKVQLAVLAGNGGDAACLPALHRWSEQGNEALTEHTRWAIRRIEERKLSC